LNARGFNVATGLDSTGSPQAGSKGEETTYFGNLTKEALIKYQNANRTSILTPVNLTQGTGFFGPSTIKHIKALGGTPTTECLEETTLTLAGSFTRNLTIGSRGEDVKRLQVFLNQKGFSVATTGPGSPNQESTYFGNLTKEALIKYQNANRTSILTPVNLTKGTGFFGPSTIRHMNSE